MKLLSPMYGANAGVTGDYGNNMLLSPMYGANFFFKILKCFKTLLSPMYGANNQSFYPS